MFRAVLVANRGEIAVRVMRTCRTMGIRTVAVYSDADRGAPHVRCADEAVRLGPAAPARSYLDVAAVVEAARRTGAEAVHPGYGFLSENPALAEACAAAGIAFVGPSADAMRLLGDKPAARRLAAEHGVPVLPGFDGDTHDDALVAAAAEKIGFPVMVKAAAGGGGRGMRLVPSRDALGDALAGARREAQSAFGDDRLLLERAVAGGRHVEVQVLADAHGHAVHLGERDCSIQRRHQKVVEEAPSPALSAGPRERMGAAAIAIVRAARYVNAGTMEFLLDGDGALSFIEANARLQVEHPVTESVTGLDLVELQLRVAAGEPLPFTQGDVRHSGHAIECRVYAEDPARGYLPSSGRITCYVPPPGEGIRIDSGVEAGTAVPAEYDPLLAKLVVHAPSRQAAVDRCARALEAFAVEGVRTNLGLLQTVVSSPEFASGTADLATLEAMPPQDFLPRLPDDVLLATAAADIAPPAGGRGNGPWEALGPWRLDGRRPLAYQYHGRTFAFEAERVAGRTDAWRTTVDGREYTFSAPAGAGDSGAVPAWTVTREGACRIVEGEERRYVLAPPNPSAGDTAQSTRAGRAGTLRAPIPGVVARLLVSPGERVRARQPLVVIEAMKIEHIIESSADGIVRAISCEAGRRVAEGEILIEVAAEQDDGDAAS
ncbi:MAG: 3-methylcrotonyl-CoA carboxylase [Chloroflexota bacterium]|nr:3-methylcrotonyl-CoA carboxylase [Chloroflexota bacterium]